MYTWDILMDWGVYEASYSRIILSVGDLTYLCTGLHPVHLRDELLYNRRWVYYFGTVDEFAGMFRTPAYSSYLLSNCVQFLRALRLGAHDYARDCFWPK